MGVASLHTGHLTTCCTRSLSPDRAHHQDIPHLILLPGDVDHVAADPAAHHGHSARHGVVGGRELVRSDGDYGGCGGPSVRVGGVGGGGVDPIAGDCVPQERLPLDVI